MLRCSKCGKENSSDAGYCTACGTALAQPVPAARPAGLSFASSRVGNVVLAAVCLIYLINPTAGVLELLPDNLPLVGNLDEIGAVTGLYFALNNLGYLPFRR